MIHGLRVQALALAAAATAAVVAAAAVRVPQALSGAAASAAHAGGATRAAQHLDDPAIARAALLRASDLPGKVGTASPSALTFLTAITGQAACDPSADGLSISGQAVTSVYTSGPVDVQASVTLLGSPAQAGDALRREVRALGARCLALRVSRVGFELAKLEAQGLPSLGAGAMRLRGILVLPQKARTRVTADLVVATKGRALVRLWLVSVGKETAPSTGNALVIAMLKRLPEA